MKYNDVLTFYFFLFHFNLLHRSRKVTLVVIDVNDSPPIFQFANYRTEVIENATLDTAVIVVEAVDSDSEVSGNVSKVLPSQ